MVTRFFLPKLRFPGIILPSSFCVRGHIHTNKTFLFLKSCAGRTSKCKQLGNGIAVRRTRSPARFSSPPFQNVSIMTNLQEPPLVWMDVNDCLSDHLGPRGIQAKRTQQYPQRVVVATQGITSREGSNFLKCNMLLEIYPKVLKNTIINNHVLNLKYKILMRYSLRNRQIEKSTYRKLSG